MQITGEWYVCDDAIARPIIRGAVQTVDGVWEPTLFLVDTGADRTVLNANALTASRCPHLSSQDRVGGIGGLITPVIAETAIGLPSADGGRVTFQGQFAALTDPDALDVSVLGRDITELFAVIVDRPGDRVCLVGQRHGYAIIAI